MATTDTDNNNYLGELFLIGANQTPFLNMIGGLGGGQTSTSFNFPVAQPYALSGASQDTQSEDTAAVAGTPTTIDRGQDYNVVQIMKNDAEVTFAKQSAYGQLAGLSQTGVQPVTNELGFQKAGQLRQIAINIEYSCLQGTYVGTGTSATNTTTRGIIEAATTNTVNASSATLSKDLVDEILREMADNGAVFQNMVMFCGAFQKQKVSDVYGFAPTDRNVGGLNIQQIETDFAKIGIVWAPQMPAATLLIADMSVCAPVFCPYEGQTIFWTDAGMVAAKKGGFYYTQFGLDYGPEEYHGTITSLATS